ncbi:hypothetical protein M3649_19130 [Ureibacillus chungkukjangi]|uniref:hypothetical protein n=1 Tax=Ureibacillus chungkukjangi TaxID=1202712 RepID=UPI00203C6211|nr:hypothetical protein [Ureibacillus chungkukjangi]MCM3390214.1 hypothetical protein [Ureibacillus chungkukjangi]
MKLVQLLGSMNKADFALYLGYTIASYDKRVLIVDSTKDQVYRYGYTRLEENEYLYELQHVEILTGAENWRDVVKSLQEDGDDASKYDCIIVDVDSMPILLEQWPNFDEVLYVSDNDRLNVQKDIPLLHRWLDESSAKELRRIHFESAYKVPEGLISLLMNNRIEFSPFSETLEYDDLGGRLRLIMQHDEIIPYKKLSKQYKQVLTDLVTEWLDINDLPKAKPSFFGFGKKDKHHEHEVLEG